MLIQTPIRLLGDVDCQALKAQVLALEESAWYQDTRRQDDYDVHGETQSVVLIFCSGWPEVEVSKAAGWPRFADVAVPMMQSIIAAHYPPGGTILRAMFARLLPGCRIPKHRDTHPSFSVAHRIHVPLQTNAEVEFIVGAQQVPPREAVAFELNNSMPHQVTNNGTTERIHFIFDYAV
ncbi:aspartyl/asparaginyl beta-hydroxylase domain-containing protein [Steroidobacter sp.]|uniref:aspartyl/asparaginyl beta-hydroxylase domain-containing protein n=1 Tax=Steroidobacter sp. TaxID=1978227 RepID=UPI001A4F12EA|nr:aspartyl/asparaginyl beta-hydroxylase domain-containing protein [Steroidobacter sp.]MBL8267666.1 aspartyl/asparaginyl beta-hydroxylase domain-containing protein [Steroidobacter sp.]